MTEGDEKYKLGELNGKVESISSDVTEVKGDVKTINNKLDKMNAVTVERWEKRNAYVDDKFLQIDKTIKDLQDINAIEMASGWRKIRKFLENGLIQFIGASILTLIVISMLYYASKASEYSTLIKQYQTNIKGE